MNPGDKASFDYNGKEINPIFIGFGTPEIHHGSLCNTKYFFVKKAVSTKDLGSLSNATTINQQMHLSMTIGSEIGFKQSFGVEVSGGVNIPFIAEGKVKISGEIGFSQAFSSSKTVKFEVTVPSESIVHAYEAEIEMQYYKGYFQGSRQVGVYVEIGQDIIGTGQYGLTQNPI